MIKFLLALAPLFIGQSFLENSSYVNEVNNWHTKRVASLKKDFGWLSLIALDWLDIGKNDVKGVGTIFVTKEGVSVTFAGGVQASLDGKKFVGGLVAADKDRILFGSKALSIIHRSGKYAVRIWDSETPARKNFTGIDRYPVLESWKIKARWEAYAVPKRIEIPTVISGLTQEGIAPGKALFMINGKEYTLEPTVEEGEEEYFFVFGDKTNGKETYGAGRFLYSKPPRDGFIELDFNMSYNPPCVFTDYATCPVPSPHNILPVKIEAGEKKYQH